MKQHRWIPYLICAAALLCARPQPARAGIPVIDWSNIIQSTISAVEDVSQGAQLVLDYKNQLQQYERMLTDAVVPAVYVWDQINKTVDALHASRETLRNGKAALRDELTKFTDPNYYRSSSCYNSTGARGGCFEGYKKLMAALRERESEAHAQQDEALDAQLDALHERAEQSKKLKANAENAKGQLEAIQYTNQLLDAQYSELRDTRALLITQQQVAAEEQRKQILREAASQALSDQWHGGDAKFKRSNAGSW